MLLFMRLNVMMMIIIIIQHNVVIPNMKINITLLHHKRYRFIITVCCIHVHRFHTANSHHCAGTIIQTKSCNYEAIK